MSKVEIAFVLFIALILGSVFIIDNKGCSKRVVPNYENQKKEEENSN